MSFAKKTAVMKEIRETAKRNKYPLIGSYWQFFKYAYYGKYSPTEIFMMDLLNPAIDDEENKGLISAESFLRYQEKVNLASHLHLTEDKIAFHKFCVQNELPVPELVASIDKNGALFWGKDNLIKNEKDFLKSLKDYPYDIICKPNQGAHGKQVTNIHFVDGKHLLDNGSEASFADFIHSIFEENNSEYIFQKKLYSHHDIVEFTDNKMLQTMRIETYLDDNNHPHILSQSIKFPAKGSVVDNFVYGTMNNRICHADKEGLLISTLVNCQTKRHLLKHDYVKNAVDEIATFKIPLWEQCVELVLKAQALFSPLKTIGWDVAITDEGPVLIEGNAFWDPHTRQEESMRELLQILKVPTEQKLGINRFDETIIF